MAGRGRPTTPDWRQFSVWPNSGATSRSRRPQDDHPSLSDLAQAAKIPTIRRVAGVVQACFSAPWPRGPQGSARAAHTEAEKSLRPRQREDARHSMCWLCGLGQSVVDGLTQGCGSAEQRVRRPSPRESVDLADT